MALGKLECGSWQGSKAGKWTAVAVLLLGCFGTPAFAQMAGQKTFSSADEASKALLTAVQNNDEKAMVDILGPEGKQIITSGDETADANSRTTFVEKYAEMHRLVTEPDGSTTLYIGAENWPTPIPLVNKGNLWYFDTEAGKREIVFRRVGQNEIFTIGVCQELVNAQKDYFTMEHQYAPKIYSDAGQRNGLYWKAAQGQPESPVGPLLASAVTEGYAGMEMNPNPYHGYYYHSLKGQGKKAPGGAKSYMGNGKMTQGFAFVAYPAEYRSSGVMTFMVSTDGVVYQKDLGEKTEMLAKKMTEFNPDSTWSRADEPQEQMAGGQESN